MVEKTDWNTIKKEIYKSIHIPSVFSEALGIPFDLKKRYINPFRPSKSADSGFFKDKDDPNIYYFYDFVEGHRYDIFECLQLAYNYSFIEAIDWIANTYNMWDRLSVLGFKKSSNTINARGSNMAYFNMLKAKKAEERRLAEDELMPHPIYKYGLDLSVPGNIFQIQGYRVSLYSTSNIPKYCLDFWQKRGFSHIPSFCYAAKEFISESGKVIFRDSEANPMFFFIGENQSGQIYRPFADKKTKFRNIGSTEFIHVGGNKDFAIISKGFKDFNELKVMGFTVAGKCGESAKFDPNDYMFFKYKYIVLLLDNDEAGIKAAIKQIEYYERLGIKAISITMPESMGLKDVDDSVVSYGPLATKKLINHLIKVRINDR